MTESPIRVLHVTAVETPNYYLNNLADHFSPQDLRLTVVTLGYDRGLVSELRRRGVEAQALGLPGRRNYLRAVTKLVLLARASGIDIVHGHLFEPTLLATVVAGWLGRPLVVTRHHSDAVHRLPGSFKRSLYRGVEGIVNRRARVLIAPARRVVEVLTGPERVPPSKVRLIPYGQSRERFAAVRREDVVSLRAELGMNQKLALVCVCRLHSEKGHVFLFRALAGLEPADRNFCLYLVGTGPERESLERLAGDLGLAAQVRFLGWRDDALLVLAAADLVVHPSLHEALPSAVIEAVLLERPIVATDVSGVRDILGDGQYGRIVPAGDAEALRKGIQESLHALPALGMMAAEGAQAVFAAMGAEGVARAYLDCYRDLLRVDRPS